MRWVLGVVLTALVAASCSSGDLETPADTLRQAEAPDSPFGYVLESIPAGYELCAVSTPSALSLTAESSASLHVYADGTLDDPYQGSLYGVALFPGGPVADLVLGQTTDVEVNGTPARLGTAEGFQVAVLPPDAGRVLSFSGGAGRVVQLVVRGDDSVDLVELADSVRVSGDEATIDLGGLPPGSVDLGDLYELEGRPRFRFSLDFQQRVDGAIVDQITLLGSAGDAASMNAFRFRAASSEQIEIAGSPGVVADIGDTGEGPNVVTWLVDDELILRVFSFVIGPDELIEIAASAAFVDGEAWDDLQRRFDPADCQF